MGNHRHGAALGVVAAIVAAGFGLWVLALDQGAVFGPVAWTYVAWNTFALICSGLVVWLWLAVRPVWDSGKTRVPRGMVLRPEFNPQHRPEKRPESPWWYVRYMTPTREFSPAVFRVKVNETPQTIRAHIAHDDKVFELMERRLSPGGDRLDLGRELQATNTHAVARDIGSGGATMDFRATPLTPRDSLVVVAESNSPTLRITRVKWLKRGAQSS